MRREVTRYMEPGKTDILGIFFFFARFNVYMGSFSTFSLFIGHWFMSLYNDDGDAQEITFYAAVAEDMTQNCPNGCSGNGQCLLGHCQCNPGFGGDDCSESEYYNWLFSL